jgi:hypothetical protein
MLEHKASLAHLDATALDRDLFTSYQWRPEVNLDPGENVLREVGEDRESRLLEVSREDRVVGMPEWIAVIEANNLMTDEGERSVIIGAARV